MACFCCDESICSKDGGAVRSANCKFDDKPSNKSSNFKSVSVVSAYVFFLGGKGSNVVFIVFIVFIGLIIFAAVFCICSRGTVLLSCCACLFPFGTVGAIKGNLSCVVDDSCSTVFIRDFFLPIYFEFPE